jgi:hypothetical protein
LIPYGCDFLRNLLAQVPKGLRVVAGMLGRQFPKLEAVLRAAPRSSGSSPTPEALLRLAGALLVEAHVE